jgi:hypothetical protein
MGSEWIGALFGMAALCTTVAACILIRGR